MSKNLEISPLLDYYGKLLTDKQRNLAELYYDEDLSLAEIAELTGITRQGVHDSIKRTEVGLLEFEQIVGMVEKTKQMIHLIQEIHQRASYQDQTSLTIQSKLNEIQQLTSEYLKQFE